MTPLVPARRPDRAAARRSWSRLPAYAAATPAAVSVAMPAALALLLGLWQLDRQDSMWRDEAVTYEVAHRHVPDILRLSHHVDVVHVVYYLFMHGVFDLWDGGLYALRLPSVLAIAVAAGFVAAVGNLLGGPRHGLVAGCTFAALPLVQKYAQEGRSYALVAACVAAMTYLLVRHARRGRTRLLVGYTLVAILACWLNEFAILAVLAHAVAASGRQRRGLAACAAVLVVAISPLIVISRGQTAGQLYWLDAPDTRDKLQFVGLAVVCAVGARLSRGRSGAISERRLALSLWVVPTLVLLGVSILYRPYYVDRYVLYGAIGLALGIARILETAIAWATSRRGPALTLLIAAVAAVLVPWTVYNRYPSTRKDDVIAISRTLHRVLQPGDGVLFVSAKHREWTLWTGRQDFDDLALAQSPVESGTLYGREASPEVVAHRIMSVPRIVSLENADGLGRPTNPDDRVKAALLRTDFVRCAAYRERGGQVVVYARSSGLCNG